MLPQENEVIRILKENASTFKEKYEIRSLMESEMKAINNIMIGKLYSSALDKSHVDFDDIPESKGDITKYHGYKQMVEVLQLIDDISKQNNHKIDDVQIVQDAIRNITAYREQFEKGFRLDKEFIILQYNVLVYACVEATSGIISSYVDFVKRPDVVEFTIIKGPTRGTSLAIKNLNKFNLSVKKGDFQKVINSVIQSGKESFIGTSAMVIPAMVIAGLVAIVPITRELIFAYYYSRMKVSDYLKQQATLLEINRQSIEATSMPAREKNAVIKKQADRIKQLNHLSEKIKVDRVMADNKASINLQNENRSFTVGEMKSQAASVDNNGFQLL